MRRELLWDRSMDPPQCLPKPLAHREQSRPVNALRHIPKGRLSLRITPIPKRVSGIRVLQFPERILDELPVCSQRIANVLVRAYHPKELPQVVRLPARLVADIIDYRFEQELHPMSEDGHSRKETKGLLLVRPCCWPKQIAEHVVIGPSQICPCDRPLGEEEIVTGRFVGKEILFLLAQRDCSLNGAFWLQHTSTLRPVRTIYQSRGNAASLLPGASCPVPSFSPPPPWR